MGFKPLADHLLAKLLESEEKTESGIIIPDTVKEKPQKAEIIEVGNEVENIKKNDKVLFAKYSGTEVKMGGEDYIILKEEDILGIFED
ncbi:MAG: co-chaperone GroES [Deltaproteobacteria bacterium]|nr:co-chaperone GroES [Deltaproteobacteria bacterium]MEA1995136.1 co-chaperone GroES [Campylobacterota bacterium]